MQYSYTKKDTRSNQQLGHHGTILMASTDADFLKSLTPLNNLRHCASEVAGTKMQADVL